MKQDNVSFEQKLDELMAELNRLVERLQALTPGYKPPVHTSHKLVALVEKALDRIAPESRFGIVEQVQGLVGGDLFDMETWKGLWYLVDYSIKLQADIINRRFTGKYETDDWGLDWELLETVIPFVSFLYEAYWRAETTGMHNIPLDGRALLVSNHSGQLPWDGVMIGASVWHEHPSQRLVRALYSPWFATVPFLSAFLTKMGQVPATVDNGVRLLQQEELVAVFPEGHQGAGKLFKDRYQLARFGRGEFVKMALAAQAPIVPVSVVGAEETYISLAESPALAKLLGLPRFPITPTFPCLGLVGLIPLPTKWYLDFGEPIFTNDFGPNGATDLMAIKALTGHVRDTVQEMVNDRLAQRRSIFLG